MDENKKARNQLEKHFSYKHYRVVIKSAPENAIPTTKCMPTVNMWACKN